MTRISEIVLIQQPEFHALTIRKTINFMNDFSDFAEHSYEKIMKYLESIHVLLGGEPIVCFHNMDFENLDVEVGFPIATLVSEKDDMSVQTIPSQKVVFAIDLGAYEKQDWEEIFAWIRENGHEMQGKIYLQYLNDPNRPETEFLTKIIIPVK